MQVDMWERLRSCCRDGRLKQRNVMKTKITWDMKKFATLLGLVLAVSVAGCDTGPADPCMDVDCSDGNECTGDVCASADGSCSNPNVTDGTACDFSGADGVCMSGTCEGTPDPCMDVDCSDGNECTEDVCDSADGSCSNPNETDGTACDFSGEGGICMSGMCEDEVLCNGVDCSDGNDCTEDLCDPADGSCSNPNETDGEVCDASGNPGTCQTGVCVGLCFVVDCSDGNDCTEDVCDPADGLCSNPNETDDTVCEFSSGVGGVCISGTCEDAML
jgi:hypothetical protein